MDYDNTNRGALFKNEDKRKDTDPDYKGSINCAEDDYWISAWVKTSKAGKKYMSLSISPKAPVQKAPPKAESKSAAVEDEFDDDLPF